jgi:hypothetical protein
MKSNVKGSLPCRAGLVFVMGWILLAGCSDILQGPPEDSGSLGSGQVVITIGSEAERTVLPRMDQFSKIVLSFERKNGSGTMSPVEVSPGETLISLSPGTWELTASAYNRADPPVITAQAKNTLTRTGDLIEGKTYFALAPVGTGPGILRYTVAPPQGIALDAQGSFIKIEKDAPGGDINVPVSGAVAGGELSLDEGRYTVSIVLDDQASIKTAVYWETVVLLPGLVTEIVFAPLEGDFLDPEARAA